MTYDLGGVSSDGVTEDTAPPEARRDANHFLSQSDMQGTGRLHCVGAGLAEETSRTMGAPTHRRRRGRREGSQTNPLSAAPGVGVPTFGEVIRGATVMST